MCGRPHLSLLTFNIQWLSWYVSTLNSGDMKLIGVRAFLKPQDLPRTPSLPFETTLALYWLTFAIRYQPHHTFSCTVEWDVKMFRCRKISWSLKLLTCWKYPSSLLKRCSKFMVRRTSSLAIAYHRLNHILFWQKQGGAHLHFAAHCTKSASAAAAKCGIKRQNVFANISLSKPVRVHVAL